MTHENQENNYPMEYNESTVNKLDVMKKKTDHYVSNRMTQISNITLYFTSSHKHSA